MVRLAEQLAEKRSAVSTPLRVQLLHDDAKPPRYGRPGDAGLDISAAEDMTIPAGERRLVKTGLSVALPPKTVGLLWDRSGLAGKHGITVLSGVLDETYRGEILVVLLNTSQEQYQVHAGDRIAQLLVQPIVSCDVVVQESLDETVRGDAGFGSSGR
jgi:dUTP pyrophosphatase